MAPSRAAAALTIPSLDPLPNNLRLPSEHPHIFKTLSSLSRPALLKLATKWCAPEHIRACGPYINDDYDRQVDDGESPWTAATSVDELVELYDYERKGRKGGSKREVLDRILEGDWRHGVSLCQLAMAETAALLDGRGASRKWSALMLAKRTTSVAGSKRNLEGKTLPMSTAVPNFHAQTFILSLHKQISALAKAHYHITRSEGQKDREGGSTGGMTVIRIALFDTPYATLSSHLGTPKVLFLAFPDGAPFIYVTLPASGGAPMKSKATAGAGSSLMDDSEEGRSLHAFVLRAIPLALSKPHARYELKTTTLTARSLDALINMRGSGKGNAANGGWSIYADDRTVTDALSLAETEIRKKEVMQAAEKAAHMLKSRSTDENHDKENTEPQQTEQANVGKKRQFEHADPTGHLPTKKAKRLKSLAAARFGVSGHVEDGKPLARIDVLIRDGFDAKKQLAGNEDSEVGSKGGLSVTMSFDGAHVFAGVRGLVEAGVIDGNRVPGWMTGESGTSFGVVRGGRLERAWDGI
jgi:central kinetochore subunit Mis15/CHL4